MYDNKKERERRRRRKITYVAFPVESRIPEPPDAKLAPLVRSLLKYVMLSRRDRKGGGLRE